ncbi:MAG: heme ABC exporter ATP-binding protein CcmA [Caldilineaceae bacterium]|nr:heme ABC exporter ATP-binding protein CcmA [Caldilineaceae bacterium]
MAGAQTEAAETEVVGTIIRVQNVAQRYGRKPVLRSVSLEVKAGEVAALLGANGAGKTTLLRILSGLDTPERGEVWLGNVPLTTAGHEIRRYVGLVSHKPLVYDNLSGLENLHFFARMYDIVEPDSRIEAVLTAMDLWRRRYDPVRTYSRGMIQRLAIGRAILHDPPVLLLDEPDTGLDQESVAVLTGLIDQLRRGGRAVLVTTHNWDRAERWADQVYHLVDGVIEDGTDVLGQR